MEIIEHELNFQALLDGENLDSDMPLGYNLEIKIGEIFEKFVFFYTKCGL